MLPLTVFALTQEEELAMAYGDIDFVELSTGTKQPIVRAPSVSSVITAHDIKIMGATDLDEVLETVPGLHVSRSSIGYNPIYTFRGIHTAFNPQALMLVNGIPVTGVTFGNRSQVWAGMPLENIKRIEVIRGPGSALYGADAFSGVINLITKTSTDVQGTEIGARAASFESGDVWVQHGGSLGEFDVAAYARLGSTQGQESIVRDAVGVTGPVNLARDAIDLRFDVALSNWRLRLGYQQRGGEMGAGLALALDPGGFGLGERTSADLSYDNPEFIDDWAVTAQASYFDITEQTKATLFPAATAILFGFPAGVGVIGNPSIWERHLRLNASASYSGLEKHSLRFGVGTQTDDLYRVSESKNFALITVPGLVIPVPLNPLGSVVGMTATALFITPRKRTVHYVYVQDEWNVARDWYLTAGVRHDNYSDFGGTTNPRLALAWDLSYDMTAKVLYGKAFRAPSFSELYNANNPVATGNANLKPEEIETWEAALSWRPSNTLRTSVNVFRYEMKDILQFVPNTGGAGATAANQGKQRGTGIEAEMVWDAKLNLRVTANFAQQRSIDVTTNRDAGNAPHYQLYTRGDWLFMPHWTLSGQLNHVGGRKRVLGDTRPDIADYTTTDATLRRNGKTQDWDFSVSIRNLFDIDAREPSPYVLLPGATIVNDLPLAGREWRFEVRHKL